MSATQSNSQAKIKTPLGPDVLLLSDMTMTEELGRLFSMNLTLLSEKADIKFEKILGENITIELELAGGGKRYFNGYVTSFSQTGGSSRYTEYQATVQPWFWFLTRTADCRIFQKKSVPDIVKEVFRDLGFSDFKDKLTKNYRTWEYCVQYRETDFNFVSRLLEQEGIYYYFTHKDGVHELVLSDGISAHQPLPSGYSKIDFYPPDSSAVRKKEDIFSWQISKQVQPGKYELNEFDFEKPTADLITKSDDIKAHQKSDYEIYDYPGEYVKTDDGDKYVQARIEELHSEYETGQGQSGVRVMNTGFLFKLDKFSRADQNREYLITNAMHTIHSHVYDSGGGDSGDPYSNSFSVIDSKTPYRAARITPKPIVQGAQTAIVVGPDSEEIHTDKYGRVKIQFHWDRYGKKNENSSCWVRVAQIWAGKKWGGIHIPRIGQEVIVDFMEGDPDQPIITGRVYNADHMPPYDLPENKTQSGIKSRSSKDGTPTDFNEIRMEDKKGEEELYIHAEKNQKNVVENNETTSVGHNRTEIIGKERGKGDETITIYGNRKVIVGEKGNGNEDLTVRGNRDRVVEDNETIDIGKKLHITAGSEIVLETGASKITMTSGGDISIEGMSITIKAIADVSVEGAKVDINGSMTASYGSSGPTIVKGAVVKIN